MAVPQTLSAGRPAARTGSARVVLPGLGLACLAALFLFVRLDLVTIWDGDEPKAPLVARTMVETHDWLHPRWNDRLRLEKPPLYPWLVALGLPADGVIDEAQARRPAAIAAAVGVAATVALGWRLAGPAAGWIAGLVLLTSPLWVLYARQALVDTTLAALCALATLGFAWALPPHGRRWAGLLGFAAVGLAFLAKGPLALLPVLGVLVLAAARWHPKVLGALPWGWGSLLAAAIGLPWFVLIAREHLPELTHMVLSQVLDRVTTGAGVHPRPAWWYLLVLPANVFPWSLFLPAVVWELSEGSRPGGAAGREGDGAAGVGLAAATAAMGLLVLVAIRGKFAYYLLPLYPTLAVLVGAWWAGRLAHRATASAAIGSDGSAADDPLGRQGRPVALVVGALALALTPLALGIAALLGQPLGAAAWLAGLAMLAGGWLLVHRPVAAAGRLAGVGLVAAATCAALVFAVSPLVDGYRSSRPLAAALAPYVDGRRLLIAGPMITPTALLFYEPRLRAIEIVPFEAVPAAVAGGWDLALVPAGEADRLLRRANGSLVILRRVSHRGRRLALLGLAIAERLDTLPARGEPPGLREHQPPGQALATGPQGAR